MRKTKKSRKNRTSKKGGGKAAAIGSARRRHKRNAHAKTYASHVKVPGHSFRPHRTTSIRDTAFIYYLAHISHLNDNQTKELMTLTTPSGELDYKSIEEKIREFVPDELPRDVEFMFRAHTEFETKPGFDNFIEKATPQPEPSFGNRVKAASRSFRNSATSLSRSARNRVSKAFRNTGSMIVNKSSKVRNSLSKRLASRSIRI